MKTLPTAKEMGLKRYGAISGGKELFVILASNRKKAFSKLKFKLPNHYMFVKLQELKHK